MKKIFSLLLIAMFACLFTACSLPFSEPADPETEAQISATLLSGYPQDVLPLYRPAALLSCGFSVRTEDSYDIGKDIYTVNYASTADQQSLIHYYGSLLTEQDGSSSLQEEEFTDRLNGKIGEYNADILFLDNMDETVTVYLTLGLPSKEYVDANPYFSDYPSGLVDAYGLSDPLETTYQNQFYNEESTHYITVYHTNLTADAYATLYRDAYASKEGFSTSDTNAYAFSWQDGSYSVSVRYSGGDVPYITLDVSRAG